MEKITPEWVRKWASLSFEDGPLEEGDKAIIDKIISRVLKKYKKPLRDMVEKELITYDEAIDCLTAIGLTIYEREN